MRHRFSGAGRNIQITGMSGPRLRTRRGPHRCRADRGVAGQTRHCSRWLPGPSITVLPCNDGTTANSGICRRESAQTGQPAEKEHP
jgi:hypothetical protein